MISVLKVALGTLVAATLGGTAYVTSGETPKSNPSTYQANFQLTQYPTRSGDDFVAFQDLSQKKVSLTLDGTVNDLVKWLSKEGVSFVIDKDALKNKKISVNISNQPLDDVMSALGDVMGGTWVQRGNVYTFKDGLKLRYFTGRDGQMDEKFADQFRLDSELNSEQMKKFREDMEKFKVDMKKFKFDEKELQRLKGDDVKFFELKDLKDMKFPGLEKKDLEELKKELQKIEKGSKSSKVKVFTDSDIKLLEDLPLKLKELDLEKLNEMKDLKIFEMPAVKLQSENFKRLLKSLTPSQKELQKSRGYLLITDLTPEQRKMIGTDPKGDFSMSFSIDGESVVIKSKK